MFYKLLLAVLLASMIIAAADANKKTVIVVGPSGGGKSTLANCLVNKSPAEDLIRNHPFKTANSALGCTKTTGMVETDELVVIDTMGFGDPTYRSQQAYQLFEDAISNVDYAVDLVLFVMPKGRLMPELLEFFLVLQQKVFAGRLVPDNSALVCSQCEPGWLETNRVENKQLDELIASCGNRSFEFLLDFDYKSTRLEMRPELVDVMRRAKEESRNETILALSEFVRRSIDSPTVHLTHMRWQSFKQLFVNVYDPKMRQLNAIIAVPRTSNERNFEASCSAGFMLLRRFVQRHAEFVLPVLTVAVPLIFLHAPMIG